MFWKRKLKNAANAAPPEASRGNETGLGAVTDKAALNIAAIIMRAQMRFGNYMNKKTRHLSTRQWKVLIVLFAIAWGSASVYCIVHAFEIQPASLSKRNIKMQFIIKPPRNDSLVLIEQIYQHEKSKQQHGEQHK